MEQAEERADRLLRRVGELEHQLSERAAELAKALGDTESSAALRDELETLSNKEATTRADLESNAQQLSSIREQIELKNVDCVPLRNKSRLSEIDKQVLNRRATLLKRRFEPPKHAWIRSKLKHSPVAAEQRKSDNDLLRMKRVECNSIRNAGIDGRTERTAYRTW